VPIDLSTTLGMSFSVLLICLFYSVKIKGLGGWTHELVAVPFWRQSLSDQLLMQMIELGRNRVHGMRLFGNMFAGELIFMLIA
jgi:F-type H+-transporting ATPase subunit a